MNDEDEDEILAYSPANKQKLREKLAKEVDAYFANGGQKTEIPNGKATFEFISQFSRKQNKEQRKRALDKGT